MARIVKPGGGVALFWNVRDATRSPFLADYAALLAALRRRDTGQYLQAGRATGARGDASTPSAGTPRLRRRTELAVLQHEVLMTPRRRSPGWPSPPRTWAGHPEQQRFRVELEDLLARHGHPGGEPFDIPYRIDLWTARRSAP